MIVFFRIILFMFSGIATLGAALFSLGYFLNDPMEQKTMFASAAAVCLLFAILSAVPIILGRLEEIANTLQSINKRDNAWIQWQYDRTREK